MPELGLVLLVLVGLGIVFTGLPAAFVLIGVATFGAIVSVATGTVPLALLSALPGRLVNLLENDLLQALPLYVLMASYSTACRSPRRSTAPPSRSCRAVPLRN